MNTINLVIINDYGIVGGGAEQRIKKIAEHLLEKKVVGNVHLIELETSNSHHDAFTIHKARPDTILSVLKKIVETSKIDILQGHNLAGLSAQPFLFAKKNNIPSLFFAHDQWGYCGRRILLNNHNEICAGPTLTKCTRCIGLMPTLSMKKTKYLLNHATLGVCPSDFVQIMYERYGILKGKWNKISPWISPINGDNHEKNYDNIIYVGGINHYKGILTLVQAFARVITVFKTTKLHCFGGYLDMNKQFDRELNSFIQSNNLSDAIVFHGRVSHEEIQQWLLTSGIFVFPSTCHEASGLAVEEAMHAGCACIVSDTGGVPEFIQEKGLIVPKNDEHELATAILKLLETTDLQKKYGTVSKVYAQKNFVIQTAADKLIKIYDHLLSKNIPYETRH